MMRLPATQRVVRSIPDRAGNAYTKTTSGGRARMTAAAYYMDESRKTTLYTLENGQLRETDRYHAAAQVQDTGTRYQQHMAFTTTLNAAQTLIHERDAAELVARAIQERRPDAEIYAIAVHSDGRGNEKNVHVHAIFGTQTTLRRADLVHFRGVAYELEQHLERGQLRELSQPEREWIARNHHERDEINRAASREQPTTHER